MSLILRVLACDIILANDSRNFSAISQRVSQKVVAIATNLNYYPRDVAPCPDDDAPNDVLYLLAACVVWWPERTKLEQFDRA